MPIAMATDLARNGDFVTVAFLAHSIKSSSSNIEAHKLSMLCSEVENAASDGAHEQCAQLVAKLDARYQSGFQRLQAAVNVIDTGTSRTLARHAG